jgi:hypothetical protein
MDWKQLLAYMTGSVDQELVRSKNSCGLSFVVFEQPAKPFTTLNRTLPLRVWANCRKEPHVAFALMIPLVMIMFHILVEHMPQGAFAKQDHP